jgi:tetratricopeptide (TPR) repeat protein
MSAQYHTGVPLKNSHPDLHNLVLSCNKDGMDSLRKGNHKAAFEQLKYAEAILIANQSEGAGGSLLAVTCNNLGCYYKKMGKLHAALSYLRRALKVELSMHTEDVTVAGTHLNICAIQSKLDKHDKAVQHALCALELISNKVSSSEEGTEVTQDDYSVLAIAYHNVAVEREFLQQWDQAAMAYQQGFQVAKRCLGDQHPMTQTLQKNCNAVLEKAAKYTKDAPQGNTVNRRSPRAVGGPVGAPKSSFEPPESSNAQNPTPRLPDVQSTAQKEQPADDGMPMPQSSVRQEAADWAAAEEQQYSPQYTRRMPEAPLAPLSPTSPMQQDAQPLQMPNPGPFIPQQAMPQPQQFQMPQYAQYAAPPQPQMQVPMEPQQMPMMSAQPQQYAPAPAAPVQEVATPQAPPAAAVPAEPSTTPSPPLASARNVPVLPPPPAPPAKSAVPPPARETRGADAALTALLAGSEPEITSRDIMFPMAPVEAAPTSKRPGRRTRDAVTTDGGAVGFRQRGAAADARVRKSQFVQKVAAEKIQRAWRKWHAFRRDNQDWMTTTRICATMIQARWRAHRVRKARLD